MKNSILFNEDASQTERAGKILEGIPIIRFGEPEELIGGLLFLADEKASSFINGIILPINGGYNSYSGV